MYRYAVKRLLTGPFKQTCLPNKGFAKIMMLGGWIGDFNGEVENIQEGSRDRHGSGGNEHSKYLKQYFHTSALLHDVCYFMLTFFKKICL